MNGGGEHCQIRPVRGVETIQRPVEGYLELLELGQPVATLRLRVHTVKAGETPAGLAKHMAFDKYKLKRFLVLNGLGQKSVLRPGQKVKIVTE